MKIDYYSSTSNEFSMLQKLGFEDRVDLQRTFASILNRMRISSFTFSIIMEIISYIQILAIGFLATSPGILDGSPNTLFLSSFFDISMSIAALFKSEEEGNMIFLIAFLCLLLVWLIFYLSYISKYKSSKTFYPFVINVLYYLGYHGFKIFSVPISTITGYYMRSLYDSSIKMNAILISLGIAMFFAYATIMFFMVRIVQSSPDVDIKNRFSFWPQNYYAPLYRALLSFFLPLVLEMLRGQGTVSQVLSYVLIMLAGCGGIFLIWYSDNNVFPSGKVVLSTEYNILICASLLSIIYKFAKGNSHYYIFAFVVIIIAAGFFLSFLTSRHAKAKIDLLYSKFEILTENIKSPDDCIALIKLGIVFNAPCVTNHTLLNWAISRWPNNQPLLLMVSFIFYVIHVSYRAILELVSSAVDISPFSVYDGLLFSQIFNRLPTREQHLQRRIEGVKRLYDIPKSSLRSFWESVLTHQWDEVSSRSKSFHDDIEHINSIFQNLIFENPASECVLQEFIKFATDIQGNYSAALAAQKELLSWNTCKDPVESSTNDNESMASSSMSKLSSVKSTIFLSEVSQETYSYEAVQSGIQNAVKSRPLYWPMNFFIFVLVIAVINLAIVIIAYSFSFAESYKLNRQVLLAISIHRIQVALSQILFCSIEFTTHNLTASETVSGVVFNYNEQMEHLNRHCCIFEDELVNAFSLFSSMPYEFIELLVDESIPTIIIAPIFPTNQSVQLLSILRIFQIRAKTLAFTPSDYIGSIQRPSPEIRQMTYMFSSVCEATNIIIRAINEFADDNIKDYEYYIVLPIIIGVVVNFIFILIACPISIYGYMTEVDFLISLYSGIPLKTVKEILLKDSTEAQKKMAEQLQVQMQMQAQMHQNDNYSLNDTKNKKCCSCCKKHKRLMPTNFFHVKSMIFLFILTYVIIPLPTIVTTFVYIQKMKESRFVLDGLQLLTGFLSNLGELYLSSFRIATNFPSFLTTDQELDQLVKSADLLLSNFTELFFGGSEFFQKGLLSRSDYSDHYSADCHQLIERDINHTCSSLHSDIFFIYGLVFRLNLIQIDDRYSDLLSIKRNASKSHYFEYRPDIYPIEENQFSTENDDNKTFVSGQKRVLFNNNLDKIYMKRFGIKEDQSSENQEGLNSPWWRLFYSVIYFTLTNEFDALFNIFKNMSKEAYNLNFTLNSLGLALGIILFIIMVVVNFLFMKFVLSVTMRSLLQPILVMDPEFISESPILMRFLQGDFDNSSRKVTHDVRKNNTAQSIPLVDFVSEGVIVTHADGNIISTNKKYHDMVGNVSEEIIGLNVTTILPKNVQPLFDQMTKISQSGTFDPNDPQNKLDTYIYTEDDKEIQASILFVAQLDPGELGSKSTKCAFIITDKSELLNVQEQLKKEKQSVENLLYSILPSQMAATVIEGHKNISFDLNFCSILCAKIASFDTLCSNWNSKQIISTLDTVFSEMDKELAKYKHLTKLKTLGEAYYCTSELFDDGDSIQASTIDLISFAVKVLGVLPMLQMKHDDVIHLKIGIFTGGPFICGIIGKDRPTFEIIGKGLSIAEQIQSKADLNKIMVSQYTADLIQSSKFKLSESNETMPILGTEDQKLYVID